MRLLLHIGTNWACTQHPCFHDASGRDAAEQTAAGKLSVFQRKDTDRIEYGGRVTRCSNIYKILPNSLPITNNILQILLPKICKISFITPFASTMDTMVIVLLKLIWAKFEM